MLRSYIWVMRAPGGRNMPLAIIFSDIMNQIMFLIKILSFLQQCQFITIQRDINFQFIPF